MNLRQTLFHTCAYSSINIWLLALGYLAPVDGKSSGVISVEYSVRYKYRFPHAALTKDSFSRKKKNKAKFQRRLVAFQSSVVVMIGSFLKRQMGFQTFRTLRSGHNHGCSLVRHLKRYWQDAHSQNTVFSAHKLQLSANKTHHACVDPISSCRVCAHTHLRPVPTRGPGNV